MKRTATITPAGGATYTVLDDGYGNITVEHRGHALTFDSHLSLEELFNAIRFVKGLQTK